MYVLKTTYYLNALKANLVMPAYISGIQETKEGGSSRQGQPGLGQRICVSGKEWEHVPVV